jgi:hypothetical protein
MEPPLESRLTQIRWIRKSLTVLVRDSEIVSLPTPSAADQRGRDWLRPGDYFLAIVGDEPWTGTEPYLGADMFWDHAGTGT